jgi:Family of unknown function (DUF6152)
MEGIVMRMTLSMFAATFGLLLLSTPLLAHHGRADAYDSKHPLTVKATVTEVRYVNPHVQLYFDTKDEKSKVTHWNGEMTDIGQLLRAGWGKKRFLDALKPGTTVNLSIQKSNTPQPPGKGVALVMQIHDEAGNAIGLIRNGPGGQQ